jgi:hypothetical protein
VKGQADVIPDLRDTILDTWRTSNRLTVFLVERLPPGLRATAVPGAPRRTIRMIAGHIHNVRCTWIKTLGEGRPGLGPATPVGGHGRAVAVDETCGGGEALAALTRRVRPRKRLTCPNEKGHMDPAVLVPLIPIVAIIAVAAVKIARLRASLPESPPPDVAARLEAVERSVQDVQQELAETQERLDFAERLLSKAREERRIGG